MDASASQAPRVVNPLLIRLYYVHLFKYFNYSYQYSPHCLFFHIALLHPLKIPKYAGNHRNTKLCGVATLSNTCSPENQI